MTLVPVTYKGGVFRHDEVLDLIEDLGGYIVQKHIIAQEVVLQSFVPKEDIELIRRVSRPLAGEIKPAPLVGTEIAVISPSLEIHHLPHISCDVAEYLRGAGAKTNMVGLARGFGKRIANLNVEERDVINEHDVAIYLLGSFAECIKRKFAVLRRGINVPIVLVGGPDREMLKSVIDPPVEGYVGGIGRMMHRTRTAEEISLLDNLIGEVSKVLDVRREYIAQDPLSVNPARLKDIINENIFEVRENTHPTPVTVQIAGLRVKIPYEQFSSIISETEIDDGVSIGDTCDILPSRMRNYIWIRIKPYSETGIMV